MPGKMVCFNEEEREYLLALVRASSIPVYSDTQPDLVSDVLAKLRMPGDEDEDERAFA